MEIRNAVRSDAAAIAAIRSHYVLTTYSTFDTVPPARGEILAWMEQFSADGRHRLLVATRESTILGYAATLRYRPKAAFDDTAELSVYLAPGERARGIGAALYHVLLPAAASSGVHTFLAGVALPNDASLAFHRRQGFREVGTFEEYAAKGGHRISSTWFQKLMPQACTP
jgi:phosphinothricin acetyltransferase